MARFEYFFRETTSGLRRNGLVAFAAISTAFIALLLFGLALLISREVNLMIEATTGNVEVAVYLTDPVNPDTVHSLHGPARPSSRPSTVRRLRDKEEACERFLELFANQPALVNNVDCDALPASLRVKLDDPEQYDAGRGGSELRPTGTGQIACAIDGRAGRRGPERVPGPAVRRHARVPGRRCC